MKAIFIDHMGTIVSDEGKYVHEVILRSYKNSDARSPEELARFWAITNAKLLNDANGDNFETVYNLSLKSFELAVEEFNIRDDIVELCSILVKNWTLAPTFSDTVEFFDKCPLPIYILSNNDNEYITEAMKNIGIKPDGVITSEMARAYKPSKEIFEYALKVSGCEPSEVVHIGDSLTNDVEGARGAGIEPWLLDRKNKYVDADVIRFTNLMDILDHLKK